MDIEELFSKYEPIKGSDEFILFSNFYNNQNMTPILNWMDKKLQNKTTVKCITKSKELREAANIHFKKRQLSKSIAKYTESLCYAPFNSCEYGLALANRSAASFELKHYLNCLNDIELCLKSQYPDELKPKIYIRKASCYYYIKKYDELKEMIILIESFDKSELTEKIKHLKDFKCMDDYKSIEITFPVVDNEEFLHASSKIRIEFSDSKGRHVVAKEDVKVGDILFVEKAFCFSPIFDKTGNLIANKCFNCLKDNRYCIPCKVCTACLYCDENCRDISWKLGHNYECAGMALWYDLGISFPAMKCMFKGIPSNFKKYTQSPESCTNLFGDCQDNYMYFNSLLTNVHKMDNVAPLLIMGSIIVNYLKSKTDFFQNLMGNSQKEEENHLIEKIGGVLVRHILQLCCNSSVITHWKTLDHLNRNALIPKDFAESINLIDFYSSDAVACGIYPSVSIMNHSCKPNISTYFIEDTIIVKAAEDISSGQEIYNCYGIEYKSMKKERRQNALQSLYYFKCNCVVCNNPKLEYEALYNCYNCLYCKKPVPNILNTTNNLRCDSCKSSYPYSKYSEMANEYISILDKAESLIHLERIVDKMENIYSPYHDYLYELYDKILKVLMKIKDPLSSELNHKIAYYKHKLFNVLEHTYGLHSKKYGLIKFDALAENDSDRYEMLKNVLHLYYPINEIKCA